MSKEYLEAIERIKNKFINFFHEDNPDVECVEDALQRLENIDNANPSEALECLEFLFHQAVDFEHEKGYRQMATDRYNTIKQALIKAQEQEKSLKIMKDKWVNVAVLIYSKTVEEYNSNAYTPYNLTQEEFDLLKRWLG